MDPRIAAECRQIDRLAADIVSNAQRRKQREPSTAEIATIVRAAEERLDRLAEHDAPQTAPSIRSRLSALLGEVESWLKHRIGARLD